MMSFLLQREHELIPSNDDGEGAPLVGSSVGHNIDPEHEAASPVPNIVPAPIQAPEGATRQRCKKAKQYPPAVWQRGAEGKLERITMNIVWREYKKFNCDKFAQTFGHDDITLAQWMSTSEIDSKVIFMGHEIVKLL
jgi:hypothetical protein